MSTTSAFIEQAEYIDTESLLRWSSAHPEEDLIIRKLSRGGAKLITGPRGCGKTTLLLKAFHKLCNDKAGDTFPIYVNFKSSLKLEPLYQKGSNASFLFNQWILLKVYQGLYETLDTMKVESIQGLKFSKEFVNETTSHLELGRTDILNDENNLLSIPSIEMEIKKVLESLNMDRCVLLLDDAAHAFSSDQQRDFFEFFRQIKSKRLSPKAAIYPGVTIFSSTFHVGHDAEEIDVWIKPDSENYIEFMMEVIKRRLPSEVFDKLQSEKELLNLICYAAFGMPRALLNMIRGFYNEDEDEDADNYQIVYNRKQGLKQIKKCFENTYNVYTSLKAKVPIYKQFISKGEELFSKMVLSTKTYNKSKSKDRQSVIIAIKRPLPAELSKVLGFFQYSGLLMPMKSISKGEKGVYDLYSVHYAALVENNALFGRTSININEYAYAFEHRHAHEYCRITPLSLLGTNDISNVFSLSLPPCKKCNAPRVNEYAKFCLNCGAPLKGASIFDSLVREDIKVLKISEKMIKRIKENSNIRTIKDIFMDHDNRELRNVPYIGPIRSKRIFSYAEEYLG